MHPHTKNMINTDEQLDKHVHTVKTGRIPFTGVSVPMKLGTPPSQEEDVFTFLECPQTSYYWGFVEASSYRHDQLINSFLAPLPSLQCEGLGLKTASF